MTDIPISPQAIKAQILRNSLGDELFGRVKSFFSYLFVEGDSNKPLEKRRYIIFTRKGFALWQIAAMCGLCGSTTIGSDKVISDRNWNMMSSDERQAFVFGCDVYIVDDTMVTGHSCRTMYASLGNYVCKSRNVVVLSSCYDFSGWDYFEGYRDWGTISIEERRAQNARIMVAIYELATPYTANSSISHFNHIKRDTLREWLSFNGVDDTCKGWEYEKNASKLDFGVAGVVRTTFLIHAPRLNAEAENIFFRGMRVCYRLLSENEDPDGQWAEVTLVPWVMFDIINYQDAIAYLQAHIDARSTPWLYELLANEDPKESDRKLRVVHRVISHLFSACVAKQFFADFDDDFKDCHNDGQIFETHHYCPKLLKEINILIERGCDETGGLNCPYHNLIMNADEHNILVTELCQEPESWGNLDIPQEPLPMSQLGNSLWDNRERDVNKETGFLNDYRERKYFPIMCYTGDDRGVEALYYVRCSMATFFPRKLILCGVSYLVNVLSPGEGSALAIIKYYDFIWGLYHLVQLSSYTSDNAERFASLWFPEEAGCEMPSTVLNTLINQGPLFWPSKYEILSHFENDIPIERVEEFVDNMLKH